MSGSAMERVLTYHEATKHHPRRYARSSGYLDWAAQPDPFRRFDGAPLIRLPIPALEGLSNRPGIYHYAPREHGLQQRAALDTSAWAALTAALAPGSFLAGLSSVFWREAWKYGERAFRYCQHDVGHALGALRLAAAVLGWDLVVLEDLPDADVARLMGLDRAEDFAGAEREHPELLAVVFPTGAMTDWRVLPAKPPRT